VLSKYSLPKCLTFTPGKPPISAFGNSSGNESAKQTFAGSPVEMAENNELRSPEEFHATSSDSFELSPPRNHHSASPPECPGQSISTRKFRAAAFYVVIDRFGTPAPLACSGFAGVQPIKVLGQIGRSRAVSRCYSSTRYVNLPTRSRPLIPYAKYQLLNQRRLDEPFAPEW